MLDDFSRRLRVLCEQRGVTCMELARRNGVAASQAYRWLTGATRPRDRALVVLRGLGMSMGEFYSARIRAA